MFSGLGVLRQLPGHGSQWANFCRCLQRRQGPTKRHAPIFRDIHEHHDRRQSLYLREIERVHPVAHPVHIRHMARESGPRRRLGQTVKSAIPGKYRPTVIAYHLAPSQISASHCTISPVQLNFIAGIIQSSQLFTEPDSFAADDIQQRGLTIGSKGVTVGIAVLILALIITRQPAAGRPPTLPSSLQNSPFPFLPSGYSPAIFDKRRAPRHSAQESYITIRGKLSPGARHNYRQRPRSRHLGQEALLTRRYLLAISWR
ncbi:MAG: hypothetical protein GPOALKHO_001721 [Sodalis sp.]|uniref:hypothetical protein n=1 Tax=Sodalis sp. (in: enterobacteria) TaxID=1898979 RepID=UPI003872FC44|nr:MAG: hypothetical protein GPOALKHO_001721 [Sodalis sp.]